MIDVTQLFDSYSRQARLYPALLTFLPGIVALVVWFPDLLLENVLGVILTLAVSTGFIFFMADTTRAQGRKLEVRLLQKWGGWPTTIWLRHSDAHLDTNTKRRYHTFLSGTHTKLTFPSADAERANPAHADAVYDSAVIWLKEQCRGKSFPLVEKENATYGFRRNLMGMKPLGVIVCAAALAASLIGVVLATASGSGIPFHAYLQTTWQSAGAGIVGATLLAVLALAAWLLIVRAQWVRDAGDQYARALLANCDTLKLTTPSQSAKR